MGSWSSIQRASALDGFYAEMALIHNNCRIKRNNFTFLFTTVASDGKIIKFHFPLCSKSSFLMKLYEKWNTMEIETLKNMFGEYFCD